MAVSFVDFSVIATNGATTTTSVSVSSNLPNSTVAGDRVFLFLASVYQITAPSNWNVLFASTALGTGAIGASTGTRDQAVYYRDYDGVWTMPSVSCISGASPSIASGAMSLHKAGNDQWNTPTVTSGSDTTSGTGLSVAGSSIAIPTGGFAMAASGTPVNTTMSGSSLSASGVTFASQSERHDNGTATGNDVALHTHTASVTTGATAAPTFAATLAAASTGGAVIVVQTVTTFPIGNQIITSNQAVIRAAQR